MSQSPWGGQGHFVTANVVLPDLLNVEKAPAQSDGFPWNLLAVQEMACPWEGKLFQKNTLVEIF